MGSGGTTPNRYRVKDKMDSGEGPSPQGPERLRSLHLTKESVQAGCFQILELVRQWWEPNSPGVDLWHARDGAVTQNISGTPLRDGAPRAHSIIFIL